MSQNETFYFGGAGALTFAYVVPGTVTMDIAGATRTFVITPNVSITGSLSVNAGLNIIGTAGPQFAILYDLTHFVGISVSSTGAATYAGLGSGKSHIFADPVTVQTGLLGTSPTLGLGYATGAGGAVAQASSRSTGVVLNTVTGAITLFSAAGSATPATFVVTNSAVIATDTIIVNQKSGTDKYEIFVTNVGAGVFSVTFFTTGGTTTETPVFNFVVLKGVAA